MFKFPPEIFEAHGLKYVDKSADRLTAGEACFHKEDQQPGGDWLHYRMSACIDGTLHSVVIPRAEFMQFIADKRGEEYIRELVRRVVNVT